MKKTFETIIFDIFYLLIGAYMALMILENLKPGLVSNYLDLNKILYILAPLGILCVLVSNRKTKKETKNLDEF
jgi:CDP-diglyceride synthetase